MKRLLLILITVFLSASAIYADPFSPTRLNLLVNSMIMYDFDGSELVIPIEVRGTPARVIFCLFTKNRANTIGPVTNGYLGWHYVNKIDTCIYYSTPFDFEPGDWTVTWSGRDQDGNIVSAGEYTYYMWAFDNVGEKQLLTDQKFIGRFLETDSAGAPLDNPIYYGNGWRWTVGDNPLDSTLLETSTIPLAEGWKTGSSDMMSQQIDPFNNDYNKYFYLWAGNNAAGKGSILKYRWVAGGESELVKDFGQDGYSDLYDRNGGGSFGVVTDGEFLYTADENHDSSNEPDSQFYIYDYDGDLVTEVDLTPWWSDQASYDAGAQMNGGPNTAFARNGKVFLNCHCSCLNQMVDPKRFLDTLVWEDFFVWSNGNGDTTGDRNFEDTAQLKWVCNDYNVGPYKYSITADSNQFSLFNAYDLGAASFGLLAPDGTGLGYYADAGGPAGWKYMATVIDSYSQFDGLYFSTGGINSGDIGSESVTGGTWYVGQDSIRGIIVSMGECWGVLRLLNDFTEAPLVAGSEYDISWYSTIGSRLVYLEFSSDGGATWSVIADSIDADLETYQWTVPDIVSDHCLVRISKTNPNRCLYKDVSDVFSITNEPDAVDGSPPLEFAVSTPSPNPFNPLTTLRFTLPERLNATVAVYNIAGQRVAVLHDGVLDAGSHVLVWDATGLAAGIYFCTVTAGDHRETVKMTLAK